MTHTEQLPPPVQMMQYITGFWTSCSIYIAAKLGIADLLANGPQTIEQLAEATHSNTVALHRVLRALASVGIFLENDQKQFELTPLGVTLRSDIPGSMKAMAIAQLGDHYTAWGNLLYSVKTGNIAFDHVEGTPVWKYYENNPEEGINFMKAMEGLTQAVIMNILPAYDFTQFKTIVDIGGGNGALMFALLNAAPNAKGIVFDEEYVVKETKKTITQNKLQDRCGVVAGSFFQSVPPDADAYVMKLVLHDWNDEQSLKILLNCAKAMKPHSKLLIIESVITEGNTPHPGKFMDLNMLVMTGGKERTEKEFTTVLGKAGLKLNKIIPTHSPMFSILEAVAK